MPNTLNDDMQFASGLSPGGDIACRDCLFRDKTVIILDGVVKPVGMTKAFCEVYVKPNSKPREILFEGADCEFKVVDPEFLEI